MEIMYGNVTAEQISEWKQKYGHVSLIEVPLNDDETEFAGAYFRKPDLKIIAVAAKFAESDPIKSGTILFDNCWLGGDDRVKNDDELKSSAIKSLGETFKIRQARIKNL